MGYTPTTVFAALPDGLTPLALFDAEFDAISIALSNGTIPPVIAAANTVWAGPAVGGPGAPSFRGLVTADLPGGVTGSGPVVLADSPALITPNLGTPSALNLANATGLPLTSGVTGALPIANGGMGATTAGGGRKNLVLPTYVADLAALGALSTTQDALAYDRESAYANWFTFLAGDQSAIVTADPLHLYSYPPASDPTGASGVWVQPQAQTTNAFWTDLSPGALITRVANRLFVGAAAINDGALTNVQSDWLTAMPGFANTTDSANLSSGSTIGGIGLMGFARTSDAGHETDAIGVAGFVVADDTYGSGAHAGYFDAQKLVGATGFVFGLEVDVTNYGPVVDIDPINFFTAGFQAPFNTAANGIAPNYSSAHNVSAVFAIQGGDGGRPKFQKGLVFESTALELSGGIADAFATAAGAAWFWWDATSGQRGSGIYSTASSLTTATRLIMSDSGFNVTNSLSLPMLVVPAAAGLATNYLEILGASAGSPVKIYAKGISDTEVDLWIEPLGSGTGKLLNGAESSSVVMWNNTGLGFNNTVPIAKPTVTGSKGSNAALASLMTALSSYGLVTDSTT